MPHCSGATGESRHSPRVRLPKTLLRHPTPKLTPTSRIYPPPHCIHWCAGAADWAARRWRTDARHFDIARNGCWHRASRGDPSTTALRPPLRMTKGGIYCHSERNPVHRHSKRRPVHRHSKRSEPRTSPFRAKRTSYIVIPSEGRKAVVEESCDLDTAGPQSFAHSRTPPLR